MKLSMIKKVEVIRNLHVCLKLTVFIIKFKFFLIQTEFEKLVRSLLKHFIMLVIIDRNI